MDTRTKLNQDPNTSQESKDQHSAVMSIECWRIYTNPCSISSITRLCPTFWDPMDCSTRGFPAHHQLPEFIQTHVHQVGDAIQPPYPLSSPSPPAFNLSQHEGLFQWVSSLHQIANVLKLQLQHQSFQWVFRTDFLYDWLIWSPSSPRDSQESILFQISRL